MDRNVAFAAAVFAFALGVVAARPAAATVTAATITATTPSFSGKCPTAEAFKGTIAGTPGTTLQYSFNRYINGAQQVQNVGAATIPWGGSIAVSDSFSITTSSTGANFDQLWVHNIAGGQADVYSNKATFAVACGAANPYGVLHQANSLVRPLITLHTKWWGWRKYEYKWVGMSTYQPEVGTGPCADLCTGWVHIKNGDSFYLYHWNFYLRSALLFDQAAISGAHVGKATLTIKPTTGEMACFGGIGRATVSWIGGSNDFTAPYPVDADFSAPVVQQTASTFTFDVTPIVQGWASGATTNNGFVLRGRSEDNGSNGNDSCTVDFATDGVLTITQM
ncbi:MAG TPA: DNRLRE domain-containing protein [Candidatus Eremiobacteraceae bacterium]|nr:DNRLRE domain-containing protein [Candidatus Eremiobacteraceae bacterium]